MTKLFNLSLGTFLLCATIAQAQFKGYTYAKKINPVASDNYYAIPLDAAVLAKTKSNFADFRVYRENDADTAEVPFLFKWRDEVSETYTARGKIIDANYIEGGTQYITIEFANEERVNELNLEISESNFDKYVKLECSNDNRSWKTIESNMRVVGLNWWDAYFRSTNISFTESSYKYFRLTLSNVNWSPYKGHKGNIHVNGVSATFNKCLSAGYRLLEGAKYSRKEYRYDPGLKNDTAIYRAFNERPPHPKAVYNRKTDFKNPLNPTEILIELPYPAYIHHIRLRTKDTVDFYRMCSINVSERKISFDDDANAYIIDQQIFSSVSNNIYQLENKYGRFIIIKLFNYNDEALKDLSFELYAQDARLICKLQQQKDYFIAYGKKDDFSPQYDIQYFQEKLPSVYTDVLLGEELKATEKTIAKKEPLMKSKVWLWVAMAVLMAFIGFFALKLMKKQENE